MSRALDDLSERMRPLAIELLARCVEAKIPIVIVDTLRTEGEHAEHLARGVSWTTVSNHLDGRQFRRTMPGSDAIDIAPYDVYQLHGPDKLRWTASDPVWAILGGLGEAAGLVWGGRWRQKDLGHFEHPYARDGLRTTPQRA
jgi:hypothetical protein